MPIPVRTTLSQILLGIKNRLISQSVFSPNAVYIGLNPDIEVPQPVVADQFCVITPGQQVVDQPAVAGGGNTAFFFEGVLNLYIFNRLTTDETPRSDNWLTDGSLGAIDSMTAMIQSLQLFVPTNVQGNGLLYTALKLDKVSKWTRVEHIGKTDSNKYLRKIDPPGWGRIQLDYTIKWWQSITIEPRLDQ